MSPTDSRSLHQESSDVQLRWSGRTHPGRFRRNNEDAFLTLNFDRKEIRYLGKDGEGALDDGDYIFAVSDGMGGCAGGEYASKIATQKIAELLPKSFWLSATGFEGGEQDLLGEVVEGIHKEIQRLSRLYEECRGMGATLSLIWVTPKRIHFAHVGDSRIYHLPQDDPMMQISHDHTGPGRLFREGKINERESKIHPARNQLEQVLGSRNQSLEPQIGSLIYEPGDQLVLVTDGIVDGVFDRNLENMIRNPLPKQKDVAPSQRLIDEAMFASGKDNLTALVVEIAGEKA